MSLPDKGCMLLPHNKLTHTYPVDMQFHPYYHTLDKKSQVYTQSIFCYHNTNCTSLVDNLGS